MIKAVSIVLMIFAFILAYIQQAFVFPFILFGIGFFIFLIQKIGKNSFEFTTLISRHPNDAYNWVKQHRECWTIFEDRLPENYRDQIPSKAMRPLKLKVPGIGDRMVYIFGKFPECRDNEREFINFINS